MLKDINPFMMGSLPPRTLSLMADQGVYSDGAVQFTAADSAYLSSTSTGFNLGTGDAAFNLWILRGATGAKVFATKYQDASNYWEFGVNASNIAYFTAKIGGSTLISVTGTTAITSTTVWQNLNFNNLIGCARSKYSSIIHNIRSIADA